MTPRTAARQASLSITISRNLLRLMSIESVMPSNYLFFCRPFLLLPSKNLYQHQLFSNESVLCIKWPKYWSFSFSISPSSEYLGLISFRMDWLDLLSLKSLFLLSRVFSSTSLKASVLQLSLLCGPTLTSIHDHWKNHSFD